jgi:hypothetical protein
MHIEDTVTLISRKITSVAWPLADDTSRYLQVKDNAANLNGERSPAASAGSATFHTATRIAGTRASTWTGFVTCVIRYAAQRTDGVPPLSKMRVRASNSG